MNNEEELDDIIPYLENISSYNSGDRYAILQKLKNTPCYIRLYIRYDEHEPFLKSFSFGSVIFLHSPDCAQGYEREFSVKDLKDGLLDKIRIYGTSIPPTPNYSPKKIKRTLESLNESPKIYPYGNVIILINSLEDINRCKPYIENLYNYTKTIAILERDLPIEPMYIRIFIRIMQHDLNAGSQTYLRSDTFDYNYEKPFTVNDLEEGLLDNIKKYGISSIPNYTPKKIKRTLN